MEKIRYEIDPHNRLVARTGGKTGLRRFRKVYDGRFKINKANSLSYHIKAPAGEDIGIPCQVKLKGRWSLTENHDLRFTLDKWRRHTFGEKLLIKGDIMDVDKNSFLFAATTTAKEGRQTVYTIKLKGSWQADKYNRLNFKVKREHSRYDILTLGGSWEINKNHRILYRYKKAELIRKSKKVHTLIFKGHWDIKDKARISYVLDRNTDSLFDFRTGLGIFKDKYIKYEIGIGLSSLKKAIVLFGAWKIKKNKGLTFEVEYEDKKIHSISFGAEAKLGKRDSILFNIKSGIGNKNTGINLKLSRKILKGNGRAFLQFLKSRQESAIFVGVGKKW